MYHGAQRYTADIKSISQMYPQPNGTSLSLAGRLALVWICISRLPPKGRDIARIMALNRTIVIITIVVTVLVAFWIIEPGFFVINEGLEYKQQAEQPKALEQLLLREQEMTE